MSTADPPTEPAAGPSTPIEKVASAQGDVDVLGGDAGRASLVSAPAISRRPDAVSRFSEGQLVAGRYRLVRPLARGGMAELWIAEHTDLHTELVVKFLQHTANEDEPDWAQRAVERFRLEAQITAQLGKMSRHVVAAHDAGEFDGTPFIVLELVRGRSLDHLIAERGTLPPALVADVLDQIADALGAAHGADIVHRDLKPSNVMLTEAAGVGSPELLVQIADFGVAKAKRTTLVIERPKETSAALLVGSPAYASPEQLYGLDLDGRSDLWSLGVLTYEALTGSTPFSSDGGNEIAGAELIVNIATGSFEKASAKNAALPRALDRWFSRALAKEPSGRFATAREMADAFREALRGATWSRRVPAFAAAAAVALGLIVAAQAAGGGGAREAPPSASVSAEAVRSQRSPQPSATPEPASTPAAPAGAGAAAESEGARDGAAPTSEAKPPKRQPPRGKPNAPGKPKKKVDRDDIQ